MNDESLEISSLQTSVPKHILPRAYYTGADRAESSRRVCNLISAGGILVHGWWRPALYALMKRQLWESNVLVSGKITRATLKTPESFISSSLLQQIRRFLLLPCINETRTSLCHLWWLNQYFLPLSSLCNIDQPSSNQLFILWFDYFIFHLKAGSIVRRVICFSKTGMQELKGQAIERFVVFFHPLVPFPPLRVYQHRAPRPLARGTYDFEWASMLMTVSFPDRSLVKDNDPTRVIQRVAHNFGGFLDFYLVFYRIWTCYFLLLNQRVS